MPTKRTPLYVKHEHHLPFLLDTYPYLSVGSFGWSGAYGTHFWVEPTTKRCAVLMLNKADIGGSGSTYSYEFEKLVQGIFDNKG